MTTYTETRYIQITGWYDTTPPLCIAKESSYNEIFADLKTSINWLGSSQQMIMQQKDLAYQQNRFRDHYCSVALNQFVPGLQKNNLIIRRRRPCYISRVLLVLSGLLSLQFMFVTVLRYSIPKIEQLVIKYATVEPLQVQEAPALPAFQQEVSRISPPVLMQPNNLPIYDPDYNVPTNIAPPFDLISSQANEYVNDQYTAPPMPQESHLAGEYV